ncbi:MAG TPA: chemotaxis protein CheW [Actinomycetales bacterium]|nr:chemotaxis protein CheW [Actinomycetales bacterium]
MTRQFCTFRLDGHLFGVPVETVQEVLRHQSMTVVPLAPVEVSGLLNLRGQIVVTVDLRVRLDLPPREADTASVNVVVRTHDGTVSLLVDQIGDVLEPTQADFEPVPETVPASLREVVEQVCKLDGELMLVLDTERAVQPSVPVGAL